MSSNIHKYPNPNEAQLLRAIAKYLRDSKAKPQKGSDNVKEFNIGYLNSTREACRPVDGEAIVLVSLVYL